MDEEKELWDALTRFAIEPLLNAVKPDGSSENRHAPKDDVVLPDGLKVEVKRRGPDAYKELYRGQVLDLSNPHSLLFVRIPSDLDSGILYSVADALASLAVALGRRIVIAYGDDVELRGSESLVERVAARVHAAWMAEKQRQGFADHPFRAQPRCCDLPVERHHPDMVPYHQLDDATQEYDRATVRAVLEALVNDA